MTGPVVCSGTESSSYRPSDQDLNQIWQWSATVPLPIPGCVHDLVAEVTKNQPEALAVDAWDGQLTYAELDALAGALAHQIAVHGVREGDIVPIFLSKSKWMPVAMLGIIKSGAAAVALDTSYPKARLENILDQTTAKLIVTSPDLLDRTPVAANHDTARILLSDSGFPSAEAAGYLHNKQTVASNMVYISFTSGTTGSPKGACMSHANVRSAVHYQGNSLGFHTSARVLDFAPYSFDVAWSNFLHTICAGGCLCIAQDHVMLEDLASVIELYRCTLINVTPTVLRTLQPDSHSRTLETILLSGELPYPENIQQWASRVRLINCYGPTECTFKSTFSQITGSHRERPSIGHGIGACTWIVHPEDESQLSPVGCVGELYLEGPLVGSGYLNNEDTTSAAFIHDPPWLIKGHALYPGRRGRLYKTGDLVKQGPNGQLFFVGRKGSTAQVKIRGQRVEIADVEYHVRQLLPTPYFALVDVVYPADSTIPLLTLFIETADHDHTQITSALDDLIQKLPDALPAFMLPSLYYPLRQVPRASTGKADRRALRETAGASVMSQLLEIQSQIVHRHPYIEPVNHLERQLRDIWAGLLNMDPKTIGANDNFLRLGGDSVKVIRMLAIARQQKLLLSISNVLQAASLRELAKTVLTADNTELSSSLDEPLELLDPRVDRSSIRQAAAKALSIAPEAIEDILPCTPMQQGMIAMTSVQSDSYIHQLAYRMPEDLDREAFTAAWLYVIDAAPLLRTRIVHLSGADMVQIVIRHDSIHNHHFFENLSDQTAPHHMGLGLPLFRVDMCSLGHEGRHLVLRVQMHHAVFDGWSRSLIFQAVQHAYHNRGHNSLQLASFQPFVRYVLKQIQDPLTAQFWSEQFRDHEPAPFLPVCKTKEVKEELHIEVNGLEWYRTGVTPSSTLRAALGLLLAKHTNSDDIVIGATVSGRQASVAMMEQIAGPTFAIVPVRLKLHWTETVGHLHRRIQNQTIAMYDYEQFGLHNIRRTMMSSDSGDSGLFQLLLVVQHNDDDQPHDPDGINELFSQPLQPDASQAAASIAPFNSHGIMLVACPTELGLRLDIGFDTAMLSRVECERFARQLEHILHLLCSPEHQNTVLQDLPFVSERDEKQILDWNRTLSPPPVHISAVDMIKDRVHTQPGAIAIAAHDINLTYQDLWHMSSKVLCSLLKRYNVRGRNVILCLEKSSAMVVVMLAVLRAGAVVVPVSSSILIDGAQHIGRLCDPILCITSQQLSAACPFTATILTAEELLEQDTITDSDTLLQPDATIQLSDPAFVVFTPGTTTGSSKAIMWTHLTLSSNLNAAADSFGLSASSKVFQFAAYDSHVAIIESLAVLSVGGRMCIPAPQADLLDDLPLAINAVTANWICLTPSVAQLLEPKQVPLLKTIVFAGEKLTSATARPWLNFGVAAFNWYGSAEAPVATTHHALTHSTWPTGFIGRSLHARTWVLDAYDFDKLAPIGMVGELCIEGHIVADGYICGADNNADTATFTAPRAVLEHLSATTQVHSGSFCRTGDLVKYDAEGNLIFLGRRGDIWTKLHGRQIRLDEVETTVMAYSEAHGRPVLRVAAEVMTLADDESESLVLFLCASIDTSDKGESKLDNHCNAQTTSELRHYMAEQLPAYMIPTYLIPLTSIPLGRTGKVDRRRLRVLASTFTKQHLSTLSGSQESGGEAVEPQSPTTSTLRDLWASVLGLESGRISTSDHFFRLGGDSIAAMRLVSFARSQSLRLTSVQIFQNPILSDMAAIVVPFESHEPAEIEPPFSLLRPGIRVEDARAAAASLCNVSPADVEDIYPCTPTQEGLLALTARNPMQYVSRSVLELQSGIDASRLRQAWAATVAALPILRTRVVDLFAGGLVQVIIKDLPMRDASVVSEYLHDDEKDEMFLGDALCRACLIDRSFILTIHHSIYDGTLLSMLLNCLEDKYFLTIGVEMLPFRSFVGHLLKAPKEDSEEFWRKKVGQDAYQAFPRLPHDAYEPRANKEVTRIIDLVWPLHGATPAIIIQSAWITLVARLLSDARVVFGYVTSGRQVDLPGVENCAGPIVCTIPEAFCVDWTESLGAFHARLRQEDIITLPHQHYGISNIARAAGKINPQDLFQTLLVVHPIPTGKGLSFSNNLFKARSFGATLDTLGTDPFNPHALMVSCWLQPTGMTLAMSFDDQVLTEAQVKFLAQHFDGILQQMILGVDQSVGSVSALINSTHVLDFWTTQATQAEGQRAVLGRHDSAMAVMKSQTTRHDALQDSGVLNEDTARVRQRAASSLCGVWTEHDIEDVYPLTPLQESLIALSEHRPGDYVGLDILPLAPSVDVAQFKRSWEAVVCAAEILRTRIVDIPGDGLVQVVLRVADEWSPANTMAEFSRILEQEPPGLGRPLVRYGLVDSPDQSGHTFVLMMHHAAYDGVTNMLLRETLQAYLQDQTPVSIVPFRRFVDHIAKRDPVADLDFWKLQFEDLDVQHLPMLPRSSYQPRPDAVIKHSIDNLTWRRQNDILPSTIVRAAWAIVCSRYTNSRDSVFGAIVSGRQASMDGIDRVCGPTIAALPVRIRVEPQTEVGTTLQRIQAQAVEMVAFEHVGMKHISSIDENCREACGFHSMLVIQPQQDMALADSTCFDVPAKGHDESTSAYHRFNSHALMAICTLGSDSLSLQLSIDSKVMSSDVATLFADHFAEIVRGLCEAERGTLISDLNMTTEQDMERIWRWNSPVAPPQDQCIHDLIAQVAQDQPDALALSAWDGDLTYQQLDQKSTTIAHRIMGEELEGNQIIPICFEKSVWTTVAFLAVVKAGHAVLMLEPSLPEARLRDMLRIVQPSLMLCSSQQHHLSTRLCEKVMVVDADTSEQRTDHSHLSLPRVKATDLLYVVFTSGTTGVPKGCMITHSNMSSAVVLQRSAHRLDSTSRMFDYSAYSFDAHHWPLIHVLCAGGTLCVPSETQKQDHLLDSLRSFLVTDVLITPATARMIDPAAVPTLKNAIIVGDKITREELVPWVDKCHVTYCYGPSEASAWATSWEVPSPVPETIPIGQGNGQITWIVDVNTPSRLAPIGTVGELVLEGPLVGQGYLNNESATRQTFIENPPWLSKGSGGNGSGRQGRVYRTGDLVKYHPTDGTLIFMGRRDNQVKLNGRRIDLGDIEQHVIKLLSLRIRSPRLAAELVTPEVLSRSTIVVFLEVVDASRWWQLRAVLDDMEEELAQHLPAYMMPSCYEPLLSMPLDTSGKIDRRRLRELGQKLELAQLTRSPKNDCNASPPKTKFEISLRQMWAQVLHIPLETIDCHSSFFRMTGDSISAMQLMSLARRQGYSLTVSDILAHPRLADMAEKMQEIETGGDGSAVIKPFSLLLNPDKFSEVRLEVARQCEVDVESVEDCYPCTAVQKSLLAVTSKRPGDYIARISIELREDVDVSLLRKAWELVSSTVAPILRNRVVAVDGEGFLQAQLKTALEWNTFDGLGAFLEHMNARSMGLGTSLTRLALVQDSKNRRTLCILEQHHAVYDAVSIAILLREVNKVYNGDTSRRQAAPFQSFISHVLSVNKQRAKDFWRQQFSNCNATPYPPLPSEQYQPQATDTVSCEILDIPWPKQDVTPAIVVRAAWAILSARYTDSEDTVFGVLSTGRQAPVDGVEGMIAPLIAAVPVRVQMSPTTTVHQLLEAMQKQYIDTIPFEHTALSDIQSASEDASVGTKFNTLLIVQHSMQAPSLMPEQGPFVRVSSTLDDDDGSLNHFNPHAMMVMIHLQGSAGLHIEVNFDSNVINRPQASLLLGHFERVIREIGAATSQNTIQDLSVLGQKDIDTIWQWNATWPAAVPSCVHDLFTATAAAYPDSQALCSWDGELSYKELDNLTDRLARILIARGVVPGTVLPLCFDKSLWQPVAALGAMKSGAACVSMDITQPEGRLKSIVTRIQPKFILSSEANQSLARRLYDNAEIIVVNRQLLNEQQFDNLSVDLPLVSPSDLLYVVFTSGSTGEPKGVTTTHENFSSAVTHQREQLKVGPGTRVFDFVSYSFDVSWSNLLNTLTCGGCLCIPSETERRNDIPGAFNRLGADYVYFTPTVACSLNPLALPGLKILAMGGEKIPSAELARWRQVETVVGTYGPAECAQATCITELTKDSPSGYVGHSFGARAWLVEPGRIDRLAPIGAVGELLIEGPPVATGYWNDPDTTSKAFFDSPAWLCKSGRIGTTAPRVYKTGDLLRYNAVDGSMTFINRKDQMVKLRGQRVELSEVEHHIGNALRKHTTLCDMVAAEIITPSNSKAPILAMFLALRRDIPSHERLDRTFRLSRALEDAEEDIRDILPQYMIPGAYITLDELPMTTTNKIDRRELRRLGGQRKLEDLASMQLSGSSKTSSSSSSVSQKGPNTDMERRIQELWGQILGIEISSIKSQSSFLRIGGESISAMRLVAAARKAGISFTVADIFRNPRLSQLAEVAKEISTTTTPNNNKKNNHAMEISPRKPFSLLPKTAETTTTTTSEPGGGGGGGGDYMDFLSTTIEPLLSHEVDIDDIQDIFPTTNFQELAVREALQNPPGRLPYFILNLPSNVEIPRLRRACKQLVEHFEILRTVFVDVEETIWQAQLRYFKPRFEVVKVKEEEGEEEDVDGAIQRICEGDLRRGNRLGESFVAFMAVVSSSSSSRSSKPGKLVFKISHAQFDDYSLEAMFKALAAFYRGETLPRLQFGFGDLVVYHEKRKMESLKYWQTRLKGASLHPTTTTTLDCTTTTSSSSASTLTPQDRLSFHRKIPLPSPKNCKDIPLATLFHAACAIILSRRILPSPNNSNRKEVIFGRLLTGRSMLPSQLSDIVGPTLIELPIRYIFQETNNDEDDEDLWSVAKCLQKRFLEDSMHEVVGMEDILKFASTETESGSGRGDFGWRTGFQKAEEDDDDEDESGDGQSSFLNFPACKLEVFDRPHPPRTRPEIYATPKRGKGKEKGDWLEISFEGNRVLQSEEMVREVVEEIAELLFVNCCGGGTEKEEE